MTIKWNIGQIVRNATDPFDSDTLLLLEEFWNGWVECSNWQEPLLKQLRERLHNGATASKSSDTTMSSGKPKSRPPLDVNLLDLYHDCCTEVTIVALHQEHDLMRLRSLRAKVRRLLGYETPLMELNDSCCHLCGGRLIVAQDASTDVRCIDVHCGNVYRQEDWVQILLGGEQESECAA